MIYMTTSYWGVITVMLINFAYQKFSMNTRVIEIYYFSHRPFVCNLCGKIFTELRSLTRHQHSIHKKSSTTFSCTDCDYATSRKSNLVRHLKRHTKTSFNPNSLPKVARRDLIHHPMIISLIKTLENVVLD